MTDAILYDAGLIEKVKSAPHVLSVQAASSAKRSVDDLDHAPKTASEKALAGDDILEGGEVDSGQQIKTPPVPLNSPMTAQP